MSSLEIREEPIEGVARGVVLHLDGVLDQPTLDEFLSRLEATRAAGNLKALLDMEGVRYANSTALGALVTQADAFREAGGELVLFNPHPKVELVIDMLGLGALFKVCSSADEARAHIAGAGAAPTAPVSEPAPAPAAAPPQPAAAPEPATGVAFPLRAECIGCGIVLEFSQASHFRCPRCSTVYSVDGSGRIAGSRPRTGVPIEMTLTCNAQSLKAFQQFVGALPTWDDYSEMERMRLESAVAEVCEVISQKAYDGDEHATFHALVLTRAGELALRVADHGKPLEPAAFPVASDYMTEFEHRAHPTRGNLLKMCKRAE